MSESSAPPALALTIFVAAPDAAAAAACRARLARQAWSHVRVVHPVARAVAQAQAEGAAIALMLEGTQLEPMALESAWWALETNPQLAFVAFGDERGHKTSLLDALATCALFRSAALADKGESNDATRLGLASAFRALQSGQGGQLIREPWAVRAAAMRAPDAPVVRALAQLRAQGLDDASLGDHGMDPLPPRLPLQTLDERALPDSHPARPLEPGRRRVLALLQGFPMGGYAAFNLDFLPRLTAAGHALTVCSSEIHRTDWQLDKIRRATSDVVYAPGVVPYPSIPRYISHLIESRHIEVVFISHSFASYRMLPWLRRRHPDTAFLDYVHTDWFESGMYGSYAALSAASAEWLDIQAASSQALAADLVSRGAPASAVRAITINLDVAEWDPARIDRAEARRALGCAPGQPLILYAGRVSPEKRPLLAIECWKALVASGVDARFAVAGADRTQEMARAAQSAGIASRVVFLGELDAPALRTVYAAADVFHAPSQIEGIARSLYEAMAMECVPVVADVGGQRELVSPDCGVLVPHGADEVERYVEALQFVLAPERNASLAKAARARIVAGFTSEQCVSAFESAFEGAIERRRAGPARGIESQAAGRELAAMGLEIMRRHFWGAVQR